MKHFDKPAHFCASRQCHFGMATVVNGYIVSSVGDWRPPYCSDAAQRIGGGSGDLYETMVFKLDKFCDEEGCDCGGLPIADDWTELDARRYATEAAARDGHAEMVREIAEGKRPGGAR